MLLACDRLVHRTALQASRPELSSADIDAAIAELRRHRLLIQEGAWLLGLPVRARLPSGALRHMAAPASSPRAATVENSMLASPGDAVRYAL